MECETVVTYSPRHKVSNHGMQFGCGNFDGILVPVQLEAIVLHDLSPFVSRENNSSIQRFWNVKLLSLIVHAIKYLIMQCNLGAATLMVYLFLFFEAIVLDDLSPFVSRENNSSIHRFWNVKLMSLIVHAIRYLMMQCNLGSATLMVNLFLFDLRLLYYKISRHLFRVRTTLVSTGFGM